MKVLICLILLFLFVQNGFACTVSIWKIKAKAIYGKVIDETQHIIPNAVVQIYKNNEEGEKIIAETKANENGRFEIRDVPKGKYMIRAKAENFTFSYGALKLKKSSKNAKDEEIIFTLVTYGECSGMVEVKKVSSNK